MWWRFSEDFLNQPFIIEIQKQCKPTSPCIGSYILESITHITASLAHPISAPRKPSVAWRVMIEKGVMRAVQGGFSAVEWLTENNMLGKSKGTEKEPLKPNNDAPRTQSTKDTDKQKIQVRGNVALTQGELDSLKQKHSAETLERVFDMLSAYKTKSQKEYASDYRAILSWVIDAQEKEAKKKENSTQTDTGTESQANTIELTPEQREQNARRFRELSDILTKED